MIDPFVDPLGAGYHTIQSMIAIGSGGGFWERLGRGVTNEFKFFYQKRIQILFLLFILRNLVFLV